ncbi:TonB-dependent receptor [soil metagenome]
MRLSLLAVLAAALLAVPSAFAQTGSIHGIVTDAAGAPVSGANIQISGTDFGAAADVQGRYRVVDVPAGTHAVVATSVGFGTERRTVTVRAGESTSLNITLLETPLDIGEVVVSARESLTGGARGVRDVPGSATFIGQRQLERFADSDIHRVLREVPGVHIQEEDGYGLRPNIGLRGVGAERSSGITVMEDGVLIAPAPYASPAAYYFPLTGRMDGVEVRKGSSQIRYGPYTTGGAINFVSATIPNRFSGRADLLLGQNDARTLHARVGDGGIETRFGGLRFGYVVEAYLDNVDGFKELRLFENGSPATGAPFDDPGTGYDRQNYLGRFRLSTAPGALLFQAIELKVSRMDEMSNETYLGLTDDDFAATPRFRYAGSQLDRMDVGHNQIQLRHVAVLGGRFDLTTTAYRNNLTRNWYKLDNVRDGVAPAAVGISAVLANPGQYAGHLAVIRGDNVGANADGLLHVKANNRAYVSEGVQTVAGVQLPDGFISGEVQLGLRLHRDEEDRFQWVDDYRMEGGVMNRVRRGTPGTDANRIERASALAAYVQAELSAGSFTVVPGLRHENITLSRTDYGRQDVDRTGANLTEQENHISAWIPGLGLRYDATEALQIFGGVHRGFAPPSSTPEVEPEWSVNYELGTRYDSPTHSAMIVGFYGNYSNLLGSDLAAAGGGGTTDQFNGGAVDVVGLEVALGADLDQSFNAAGLAIPAGFRIPARLAYTYTDATFQSEFRSDFGPWGTVAIGDKLPYVAPHQIAGSIGVAHNRFNADLRGNYVAAMRTQAGQGEGGLRTDARIVMDASAEVLLSARLLGDIAPVRTTIFGSIYNITDATYVVSRRPAGLRPGLPRTVSIGLRTRF